MRRLALTVVGVLAAGTVAVSPNPSTAAPPSPGPTAPPTERAAPNGVSDPDRVLGDDWRRSADRAVTTSSDENGLHLLIADRRDAYRWRTAATLAEPGYDADQWIGQFCLTGSGRYAVVVYAPREFANREQLMDRGAFTAVVDLASGSVTKFPERVTLAYYNPGCGAGDSATLSRLEDDGPHGTRTWLAVVDPRQAKFTRTVAAAGQITSPVPVGDRVVAVKGRSLVEISPTGSLRQQAVAGGVPFRLTPDGANGVALEVSKGKDVDLARLADGRLTTFATAPAGAVQLRPGIDGRVYAVGGRARQRLDGRLPREWGMIDALPDSDVSTTGALAVTRTRTGREAAGRKGYAPGDGLPDPVEITAQVPDGKLVNFGMRPDGAAPGRQRSPAVGGGTATERPGTRQPDLAPGDNSTTTWDLDAACAVPRNDPAIQTYQPTPEQVEWAADLAVRGMLTFQRPANWTNSGLPAYVPQQMFPPLQLAGGGRVPAQIMLAILAQESNLWQASFHAVDGSAGNPLTSQGFYGLEDGDPKHIDWSKVDCGYGAGQVTTGMRKTDTNQTINGVVMDYTKQRAVAQDYAVNISAALRLLQSKWNETYTAGLRANNADPQYLENWWFAIWAYNTGFYPAPQPPQPAGTPWGVGWANNPSNPRFPPDRQRFLTAPLDVPPGYGQPGADDDIGYDNAKHPNHWSYPERVIGFAYTSVRRYDYSVEAWRDTYQTANISLPGGGSKDIDLAQPGHYTFCDPVKNLCDPATSQVPGDHPEEPPGPCTRDDLKCWWHFPATWTDCFTRCGMEQARFTSVEPRPYGDSIYSPACDLGGLPSGARIIDDLDVEINGGVGYPNPVGPEGCKPQYTRGGKFGMSFGSMTGPGGTPIYPSKVDLHQIGGGFGGHFWFTHTLFDVTSQQPLKVTGRWSVDPTNAWTRVFVHVPDHGAHTRQADYRIYGPSGNYLGHRAIPTRHEANTWLDLGVFDFRGSGSPRIELSNFTLDGNGSQDIAWDALAVQPLAAKPSHFVVALGDSYSSGEGSGDYFRVSDQYGDDSANRNACRRSPHAWSRQIVIPGAPGGAAIGTQSDQHNNNLDYHFLACSGATTNNVMSTTKPDGSPADANQSGKFPVGQFGERTQIDQGFLDSNTTLVTLTIGGNDAGWTSTVLDCLSAPNCGAPGYTMAGDTVPLRDKLTAALTGRVKNDVKRVIDEIRLRAPNAWIVLAGYPQLFVSGASLAIGNFPPAGDLGLVQDETALLNDMARVAATEVLRSDIPNKVTAVDVRADFAGHEVSLSNIPDWWLNAFDPGDYFDVVKDDDGEPNDNLFGPHTMHPNVEGFLAYGGAVGDRLNALAYRW